MEGAICEVEPLDLQPGYRWRWWSFAWRRDGRALDLPLGAGKASGNVIRWT
jgi:hypothetical protein